MSNYSKTVKTYKPNRHASHRNEIIFFKSNFKFIQVSQGIQSNKIQGFSRSCNDHLPSENYLLTANN